jgi:Protein of unknown function (DUF3048) N-terminal domain/Protein of unknown function (DUF3048) C-terminal domain
MSDDAGGPMSGDASAPGDKTPRQPGHSTRRSWDWRHPSTWTSTQRWGTGIGAVAVILVIALVATLAGSAAKSPSKHNVHSAVSSTTAATGTTLSHHASKPGPPVCPLTGTPAPGGKVARRPALAFKIDNYPTARPWSGIQNADIIFEEPVEGFITRLVAVFQCQESPFVGPIRSARQADQGIADLLSRPILIHVGSIDQVTNLLDASNLINIDLRYPQYGGITINPADREAPYDTYATTSGGWSLEPHYTTPPKAVFQYSAAVPHGAPDSSLSINFSSTSDETWTYHKATHSYTLSYADTGQAMVQQANGQEAPISTSNIVVQIVHYTIGPWVENSEGGLEVMVDPVGDGQLEVLRDGIFIRGVWKRASLSSPLQLETTSGQTIKLKPGTTWVDVVPLGLPITPTP